MRTSRQSLTATCVAVALLYLMLRLVIMTTSGSLAVAGLLVAMLLLATLCLAFGISRTADAILVLAFLTVPWNAVTPVPQLSFLELSDALFVVGFVLALPRLLSRRLELPALFTAGAIGLTVVGTLAAVAQNTHQADFVLWQDVFQGVVLVPVLIAWWRPSSGQVLAAAVAYLTGNAISVIVAMIEGTSVAGRYDGLTTHPNVLGTCCTLSVALVPFVLKKARDRRHRLLVGIGAMISIYGIWISGSRAALVCTIVLAILYPVLDRSTRAGLVLMALAAPSVLLVMRSPQDPNSTNALSRLMGGDSSIDATDARINGSRELIDTILHHPILGHGWSGVWRGHDIYLQTAAAIGIFGAFFLILIIMAIIGPLLLVRGPYRWLAYPGLAEALNGLVDPALGARYIWAPIVLALCAVRLSRGPRHGYSRIIERDSVDNADRTGRITP